MQARLIKEIGVITYLRRYNAERITPSGMALSPCPGPYTYHNARVEAARDPSGFREYPPLSPSDKGRYANDPRWPVHCDYCPYAFVESDNWQVSHNRLYDTASGRPEVGDLFWAHWMGDGVEHLYGVCPDGWVWDIDGPANNGPGWTRTGEPPNITASPSILTPGYHGFLQQGQWTPDLDGRTYPGVKEAVGY